MYTKTYKDYLNPCTKKDTRDIRFSKNFLNPPTYENQFIQKKGKKVKYLASYMQDSFSGTVRIS